MHSAEELLRRASFEDGTFLGIDFFGDELDLKKPGFVAPRMRERVGREHPNSLPDASTPLGAIRRRRQEVLFVTFRDDGLVRSRLSRFSGG